MFSKMCTQALAFCGVVLFATCFATTAFGQTQNIVDLYTTGIDSAGEPIYLGENDHHWEVQEDMLGWVTAMYEQNNYCSSCGGVWLDLPTSTDEGRPMTHPSHVRGGAGNRLFSWRTQFTLPPKTDLNTVSIAYKVGFDDQSMKDDGTKHTGCNHTIWLNGTAYPMMATGNHIKTECVGMLPASSAFQLGVNTIEFKIWNGATYYGFRWFKQSATYELDTTAPPLSLSSPMMGSNTDNTPTISGTTEAGATIVVNIKDNQGMIVQTLMATADGAGLFSVDAMLVPDGSYTIEVEAKDSALNSTSQHVGVDIDSIPPMIDIVSPTNGSTIITPRFQVRGTSDPGLDVLVEVLDVMDNVVKMNTIQSNIMGGTWSISFDGLMGGQYTTRATVSDVAGNMASSSSSFTLDLNSPVILEITAPQDGHATTERTPNFMGNADPDAVVELVIRGANDQIASTIIAVVQPDGAWTATPPQSLVDGLYDVVATSTRPNGKEASIAIKITIDSKPPTTTLVAPIGATKEASPTITGMSEPGATVTVTIKNSDGDVVFTDTIMADATGLWSIMTTTPLADGDYTVETSAQDGAGNQADGDGGQFLVDTVAPIITLTLPATDSTVADSTPVIEGTAPAMQKVRVFVDDVELGQTLADAQGRWSVVVSADRALGNGAHTTYARALDEVGNEGSTLVVSFVVSVQNEAVTITSPKNGGTVQGSEVVVTGTGSAGESVNVTIGGRSQNVVVDAEGVWTAIFEDVLEGEQTISAQGQGPRVLIVVVVTGANTTNVDGGCCSSTQTKSKPSWLWLTLLGVLFWRRRRM